MQLLADENVHPIVVRRLRAIGLDLEWIKESSPGALDEDILMREDIAQLVLITYDRDFGDMIFKQGFPTPRAIIYSRLGRAEPEFVADRIIGMIEQRLLENHIITITAQSERVRAFPGAENG